jgi:DNA-binding winged helix-turn-helix (wHTH) protein
MVLTRDGRVIPLTPKVYETLLLLLERDGGILFKDELMETLWPDTYVDEANITQNVAVLRKALCRTQAFKVEWVGTEVAEVSHRVVGDVKRAELVERTKAHLISKAQLTPLTVRRITYASSW